MERQQKTFIVANAGPTARNRAVLTVTSGPEVGRVITLVPGSATTLGRSDECKLVLPDGNLSRVHGQIIYLGGSYMFEDLHSTNGSFINDARVERPTLLKDGDRIQLATSTILRFSLVTEQEEQSMRQVFEASTRDGLTGLFNRKHLEERLHGEIAYASRHGTALSVVMIDLDHFKQINDTLGHLAGDAVLCGVGSLLSSGLRTEDVAGRYGGEEFLVVLRGIAIEEGLRVGERVRSWIASTPIPFENQPIAVTASIGVASMACCGDQQDRETLLKIADERLYRAKTSGRNRVIGP